MDTADNRKRLINELFENEQFLVDQDSLGYIVRDIINMNWWNTSNVLLGYRKNKRVSAEFTETQKLIALQLKEFYRIRRLKIRNEQKFRDELRGYIGGEITKLEQLGAFSMPSRANPSQYFHRADGSMTWVDCTSRATYAAKYVYQNGYIDFDGKCRVSGADDIIRSINFGECEDLGIADFYEDGKNLVKAEIFSQKNEQWSVSDWVEKLGIIVPASREWLFDAIKHVRTDPYKNHEEALVKAETARGVNERLYGFGTSASYASHASNASSASHASHASNASSASHASRASDASRASNASDAGSTGFDGNSWNGCKTAITRPANLVYPTVFRKNIFAVAGNWKIDSEVVKLAKLGWFDPFSGHGTSPLYAARNGVRYLGLDTNVRAFKEYLNIVNEECQSVLGASVEIRCADSTIFDSSLVGKFDLCYTSPPYFNFEEYGGNTGHFSGCETYDDYHDKITVPVFKNVYQYLIPGGTLAIQSEKNNAAKKKWMSVIKSIGFNLVSTGVTGQEKDKYSMQSKRDQTLLMFCKAPS